MSDFFDPFASGSISTEYPLTKAQREIWIAIQMGGDAANSAHNESVSLDFNAPLDAIIIQQVLSALSDRHEALRATISGDGNSLCVMESIAINLELIDLSSSQENFEVSIDNIIEEDIRKPFSLEDGPLMRALLISLPQQRCRLVLNTHHIICDGWSYGIILNEFAKIYTALINDETPVLDEVQNFQAYALRDKETNYQYDLGYWLDRHKNPSEELDLPTDFPRPAQRTYDADRIDSAINTELTQQLRKLSRQMKTTYFTLVYAAFCAYIARISKTNDLNIGIPFAGQLSSGMTKLVGHCVNILPFRIEANDQQTFADFINIVANETGKGFGYPDLSFGSLVSELAVNRDASRVPLIPVIFNLDSKMEDLYFGDQLAELSTNIRRYEVFDLFLNLVDRGDDMLAEWSFNNNLFSRETITRRAESFNCFLKAVINSPSTKLWQLPIVSNEEMATFQRWNRTDSNTKDLLSIPDWFQKTAKANSNKIAIEHNSEKISYRDALVKVNKIASALKQQNISANSLVALFLERSGDLPLSMLAVMQIGCAYIPLDPQQPINRLVHILEDANAACTISNTELPKELQSLTGQLLSLDTLTDPTQLSTASYPKIPLEQLAYVIYTSGSTGKPKGVAVPHLGLSNIVRSFQKTPGFSADDKLLSLATAAFDMSVVEWFLPLVSGATLCIAPEKTAQDPQALSKLIKQHDITFMQAVPTTWRLLLSYGGSLPKNLRGLCGGEALPNDLAAMATDVLSEFWNAYGPTEATVWSTMTQVIQQDKNNSQKPISIGRPIENTQIYILDEHKQQVPIGVSGMLWIGGAGVTAGYHNRSDLTAESFQENPYGKGNIYNTGDIARFLGDGDLEYLGRQDFQVKIRGFRIELGDIESVLLTHDMVQNCVVHADLDESGIPVLIAYIEANEVDSIDNSALREYLAAKLPVYMIPAYFVALKTLPFNVNGKIDRAKLPKISQLKVSENSSSFQSNSANYVAPKDDLELIVANLFQKYLGVVKFGMMDNFFESGGDSLSAVRLVIELNKELSLTLPLAVLLHSPTPKELVEKIRKDGGSSSIKSVVRLRKQDGGLPVFCLMGINIYAAFAESLGEGFDVYALLGKKENDFLQNMFSQEEGNTLDILGLADEYTELILSTNVNGPYHLLGFSNGGVVAIEVAKRLKEKGKHVELVGLLDTMLPRAIIRTTTQWLKSQVRNTAKNILQKNNNKVDREALLEKRGELLWKSVEVWDKSDNEYQGKTALFRATDLSEFGNVQLRDGLGWEDVLLDAFPIINVPGNHANLLEAENAKVIASKLKDVLS